MESHAATCEPCQRLVPRSLHLQNGCGGGPSSPSCENSTRECLESSQPQPRIVTSCRGTGAGRTFSARRAREAAIRPPSPPRRSGLLIFPPQPESVCKPLQGSTERWCGATQTEKGSGVGGARARRQRHGGRRLSFKGAACRTVLPGNPANDGRSGGAQWGASLGPVHRAPHLGSENRVGGHSFVSVSPASDAFLSLPLRFPPITNHNNEQKL